MSRILVTTNDGWTVVEIWLDDEATASAKCSRCSWTTDDDDRFDGLRDVVEEAGIHLDQRH